MKDDMARKASPKTADSAAMTMRDRIKHLTTELLIKHGYRGTSFRLIAERLDTTTTNIHYHFGNKETLVDEVVREYVSDASRRQEEIWLDRASSLRDKLRSAAALNRRRHRRFNRGTQSNRPWSLIGRLRLEIDILSPVATEALGSFTANVYRYVDEAVELASRAGEFKAGAHRAEIAVLLGSIVNSGSVLSQDAGSFERLDQLFDAVEVLIFSAAGKEVAQALQPTEVQRVVRPKLTYP